MRLHAGIFKIVQVKRGAMISKRMTMRRCLCAASAMAAVLSASQASAQPASGTVTTLNEVVVTASKRSETIQNVPASVSVITGTQLNALDESSLVDYANYLPGVSVTSGGSPGQTTITLRGIAPVGPGSTVGTYVDDTPVGSSTAYSRAYEFELDLLPYDLEQLEVLRGPQGTLYGASAMGGILKYVLKAPELDHPSIDLGADAFGVDGSDGVGSSFRGRVNVPLIDDRLALTLSGFDRYTPGYINNVGTGRDDSNRVDQYGGRAALLWKPIDTLKVQFNAMWQRVNSHDNADESLSVDPITTKDGAQLVSGSPLYGDLTQNTLIPQTFNKNLDYYSLAANWRLPFASLVSASSYSHASTRQVQDLSIYDGTYFPDLGPYNPGLARFDVDLNLNKYTQEVRLQSNKNKYLDWLIGGFYTYEGSENHQIENAFTLTGEPIAGLGPYLFYGSLPTSYIEFAGFGDLTLHITSQLDVTGGLRYSHDTQHYNQLALGVFEGGTDQASGRSAEDTVTWLANTRYAITPTTMVYGRVATGYRPGGPNAIIPGVVTPATFGADKLINYEIGTKSEFLDRRVSVDLSAFYIDWTNIQLTTQAGGFSYLGNGGKAISRGAELQTTFRPIERLLLGANLAYTKATLVGLTSGESDATGYLTGYQLPDVPKWAASATADYQWPLRNSWKAHVGGGVRYVDHEFASPVGLALQTFVMPSYTMLDLNAGVTNGRWTLKLFARNVTDSRAFSSGNIQVDASGSSVQNEAALLQPRTVGLGVDLSF